MTRRSTSDAVCSAPIRTIPRLRPRSATSSRTSLIGLQPSRGAYRLSSSRTRKWSGSRRPIRSLCSNRRLIMTPVTNRFARSCRLWMSMTVTWFASQSIRCAAGSSAARPPDQVADPVAGGLEPALERRDRALRQPAAPAGVVVVELERDRVAQVLERLDPWPSRRTVAGASGSSWHQRSSSDSTRATRSAICDRSSSPSANRNRR